MEKKGTDRIKGISDLLPVHLGMTALRIFPKRWKAVSTIDAVVAVVSKDNTGVTNLTQAQLKSIFTGETLKWEDIK
ncbi:MAG: hypothetical protein ACLUQK_15380 [Clostridium sp.]